MSEKTEIRTRRLPVGEQEQSAEKLYDMSIRFTADICPDEENPLTACLGETPVVKSAITMRIRQVVSFVPDDDTLKQYAKVLEDAQVEKDKGILIRNVRFDGYDWFYAATPDEQQTAERTKDHA